MVGNRWCRVTSVVGTSLLTTLTVLLANMSATQQAFSQIPYFGRPAPAVMSKSELGLAVGTTLLVVLVLMWPVFRPRPRRILDTILLTQKQVFLSMVGLAALGYFNYSYRLPRSTLLLTGAILLVAIPGWTVAIRRRPGTPSRAIIVGDDPEAIEAIVDAVDFPILGTVSPLSSFAEAGSSPSDLIDLDSGVVERTDLDRIPSLGGLSRLEEVFVAHEIDTAILAFSDGDSAEILGTLDACFEFGVTTMVHQDHAKNVLTKNEIGKDIVEVDVEPWDWQDYVAKRLFDITFAITGLLITLPLSVAIVIAIKLDDGGPITYTQRRTTLFGEQFDLTKFRTLRVDSEEANPLEDDEAERATRIGKFLRKTHFDEIPQLVPILRGKMTVVGPRPSWPDEEPMLIEQEEEWSKRWFVKPGLTGLAQIHGVGTPDPDKLVELDLQYIRNQSFLFDLQILVRQLYTVLLDVISTVNRELRE